MTDTTEVASDLAAWLTQIWDEQEVRANASRTVNPLAPPVEVVFTRDPRDGVTVRRSGSSFEEMLTAEEYDRVYLIPAPDQRALARIAADREILEHVVETVAGVPDQGTYDAFEQVLRLLASAYSDQAGYREEWKP